MAVPPLHRILLLLKHDNKNWFETFIINAQALARKQATRGLWEFCAPRHFGGYHHPDVSGRASKHATWNCQQTIPTSVCHLSDLSCCFVRKTMTCTSMWKISWNTAHTGTCQVLQGIAQISFVACFLLFLVRRKMHRQKAGLANRGSQAFRTVSMFELTWFSILDMCVFHFWHMYDIVWWWHISMHSSIQMIPNAQAFHEPSFHLMDKMKCAKLLCLLCANCAKATCLALFGKGTSWAHKVWTSGLPTTCRQKPSCSATKFVKLPPVWFVLPWLFSLSLAQAIHAILSEPIWGHLLS